MSTLQALSIAVLQGLTELFPVSSLGHAVVLPSLLGWRLDQHATDFLPFLVVLHVGTAAALLLYFRRDWTDIALGLLGQQRSMEAAVARRLFGLIVVATLPAIVVGFTLEHWLRTVFGSPIAAAAFLIVNGFVLFAGERLRRRAALGDRRDLAEASWHDALLIGLFQVTALFPGISRSGATIVGGLLIGFRHEDAARFSFLLATPIILGAAVLEIPKLFHVSPETTPAVFSGSLIWLAGIVAGLTAYGSTAFIMRYFRSHEESPALDPFAYYCWGAGGMALIWLQWFI